jgi:hypothetical protein
MRRLIPALLALLLPALAMLVALTAPLTGSTGIGPAITTTPSVAHPPIYMPAIFKPATPTVTNTPTPTATPLVTATPTMTPSPTATTPPSPTITNTPTPTLPPPSFNDCQEDPNPAIAPNFPVRIVTVDKVAEVVTLQNVSAVTVSLEDWSMCSINGNQPHDDIFGSLAPGQIRTFPNEGGSPIWDDSQRDDGALYNADGSLVSYWVDQ